MPRRSKNSEAVAAETRIETHVAARIRLRRGLLGLSQMDLAKALGITFQQVQKYERGSNRVSAGKLHQLGAILDVPLSFFFDGVDEGTAGAPRIARPDDAGMVGAIPGRRELDLLRCWRAADASVADEVLSLLRRTAGLEDGQNPGLPAARPTGNRPASVSADPPTLAETLSPKPRGRPPGSGKKATQATGHTAWSPKDIR